MINRLLELFKKYREIIVYIIVGGLTTIVSYISYFLFSRVTNLDYQTSTILSWVVSVIFAFFTNKIFVFRSKTETKTQFIKEVYNFVKYRVFSLVIDMLSMIVFVNIFDMHDLIAKAIVQVIIIIVNYLFSKFFVFNNNSSDKQKYEKVDLIYLGCTGVVLFLLFGIFLKDHLAPDTMCMYSGGFLANADFYLSNARIVMYFFLSLMDSFGLSFEMAKTVSWILGFLSLFFGIKALYFLLKKHSKNNLLNILTSILVVANIFVMEFFAFPEFTGIMCLGLLFTILSSKYLISFFENNKINNFIIAIVFSTLAMFSYQGVMGFIVVIPILFTLKYSKGIKDFIKKNVFVFTNYLVACLLGVLYTALVGTDRVKGLIVLKDSLINIFVQLRTLIARTMGILPSFLYAFLIALVGIVLIVLLYKEKEKLSKLKIFFLGYVSILMILIPVAPFIIIPTANIGVCGRSALALGSIIGLLLVFYIVNVKKNKWFEVMTIIMSIIILVISCYNYYQSAQNRFIINSEDEKEILTIIQEINEYEQKNDVVVNKVGYFSDEERIYNYPNSTYINVATMRALIFDWAHIAYLRHYMSREIELVEIQEDVKDYCMSNNWNVYNQGQLTFVGDVLYICLY